MKQRVISAVVALLIVLPLIILGSYPYKIGVILISLIGYYEMIKVRENKKKLPILVKIISYISFLVMLIRIPFSNSISLNINIYNLLIIALILFIPIILYQNSEKYNIEDASFLFTLSVFLGLAFNVLMNLRDYNTKYFVLILLVTFLSDTYAYIVGSLIGKHKLCEKISPKKSIEGLIGGIVLSTFVVSSFYINLFSYSGNVLYVIIIVFLLSIISTLGDLFFSSIKRYFGVKDYGNIMPGHGGVLDRVDSLLFVVIAFAIIVNLL